METQVRHLPRQNKIRVVRCRKIGGKHDDKQERRLTPRTDGDAWRVRRAVKPPPFQGGNHEFKSRTRHQYAPVIQWKNNALLMRRSEVQILSGAPSHTQPAILKAQSVKLYYLTCVWFIRHINSKFTMVNKKSGKF